MDTLLASRYLVQRCDTNIDYQTDNLYLKTDHNGNLYLIGTWSQSGRNDNLIIFDSSLSIFLPIHHFNQFKGFVLKTDTALNIKQCVNLKDSIINPSGTGSNTIFQDIAFDNDSNLVVVSSSTVRTNFSDTLNFYSILQCHGVSLLDLHNDAFFMVFETENDTLLFKSYGRTPAKMSSNVFSHCHGNLECSNNRIFIQPQYVGGIRLPNQYIQFPNWANYSIGLLCFDYQGHLIEGIHYAAMSPQNEPGTISLIDSTLYLINNLVSDATFGDLQVSVNGSNACIAKYIDPAFLTPYIYVPDTDSIGLPEVESSLFYVYPNPTHSELFFSVGDEQITGVYLTTLMGQRKPVLFSNGTVSLLGFPAGMYFIEVTTNKNKYHKKIIIL